MVAGVGICAGLVVSAMGAVMAMPVARAVCSDGLHGELEGLGVTAFEVQRQGDGVASGKGSSEADEHHMQAAGGECDLLAGGYIDAVDLSHLELAVFFDVGVELHSLRSR